MKCRRSNGSRGSRLRGLSASASRQTPVSSTRQAQELAPLLIASATSDSGSVLRIDGQTEGAIRYSGRVFVGPHGQVLGDIHAAEIFVEGSISGNVQATETLRIAASATIVGDMHCPRIAVMRGAQLRGNITMRAGLTPPSDLDESAVDTLLSGGRSA